MAGCRARCPSGRPSDGKGINNVSIVFLGEAGRHRFLLTGDIEEEIDPTLLARGLPAVEVLKVAHHGSRTASTAPFLAAVRPAFAIDLVRHAGTRTGTRRRATVERLDGGRAAASSGPTWTGHVEIELGAGAAPR